MVEDCTIFIFRRIEYSSLILPHLAEKIKHGVWNKIESQAVHRVNLEHKHYMLSNNFSGVLVGSKHSAVQVICSANYIGKLHNFKTIEVHEVHNMSKKSLELRDES